MNINSNVQICGDIEAVRCWHGKTYSFVELQSDGCTITMQRHHIDQIVSAIAAADAAATVQAAE